MGLIHLPFLKGADQTVDPKIAPLGVLKSAKNVRFDRQGRVIKRPGFDTHPVLAQFLSIGQSGFAYLNTADAGIKGIYDRAGEPVAIAGHRVASYAPELGRWRDWNPISLWSAPERFALGRNLPGRAFRSSVTYNAGYLCVCVEYLDGSTNRVAVYVYGADSMALVKFDEFGSTYRRPRIVAVGGYFVLVYLDTSPSPDVIKTRRLDTASLTSDWSAEVTIATGSSVTSEYFDACAYDSTNFLLIHNATANLLVAKVASNGLVNATTSFAGTGVPTIYGSSALNRIMAGWLNASGDLNVRSWDGALAGAVGPTTIDTFTDFQGQPTIGPQSSTEFRVTCSRDQGTPAFDQTADTQAVNFTTLTKTSNSNSGTRLASKTLDLGGGRWAWMVNKSDFNRTYYLRDMERNTPHSVCCRGQAVDFLNSDNYVSEFVSYAVGTRTFAVCMLPVVVGSDASAASPATGVDLVRIELGGAERFQCAAIGGNLYFSGGVLSMFDGTLAHESGFLDAPRIASAAATVGGSLTPGTTYRYLLTHHWQDAGGNLHLSGVSDPVAVALSSSQSAVTLFWGRPKQTWRYAVDWLENTANPSFTVRQHLWRTEGDGQIFYQLSDELGYSAALPSPFGSTGSLTDTTGDDAIASRGTVYTQGARGALSGPLQHDPPPPCRYIWAGKERAIIGGLERPNELRWSKFYFPGEALEFSEDASFRKLVAGEVRAVASLDDVWIAFTDTQIFVVTGQGPDDTGAGTFDEPKALPSDVGIRTWKSLVEWSGGLFFQGKTDMLYLMPRGIGAPQALPATQEPLRLYPTITSARLLPEANLVVFTLTNGSAGALLCFDTENQQWTLDEIAGGAAHVASAVVGGRLLLATETALDVENPFSFVDRGAAFVPIYLETAALRPHGMQADGRTRKVGVLAEYRADCSLQMQLAIDDATSYAYTKTWALGAGVSGSPLRREWDLPVQKFGAFNLKIVEVQNGSSANAGFALHGITLDTRARPGMPRLNPGRR